MQMPAYGRKKACNLGRLYFCKAAGQSCRARLPGKAAGQGCRAKLPGKAAGQGFRARRHAMVQYAESMQWWNWSKMQYSDKCVRNNNKNNKAKFRPALYVRTNAGKKLTPLMI
jgi:hypothetical protein